MRSALLTLLPAALAALLLVSPTRAGEDKPVVKTGGHFDVDVVKDVAYYDGKDADPIKHKLDLYLPKDHKDFPVLFFVHGGAWKSGDKQLYGAIGRVFAQNGVGTVVTNYRLSPKVQHPDHIKDVAKAFAWTHQNIGKYGGKADEIFPCGHSAGGHLVALLATDDTYLKAEGLSLEAVKGVVPISGVYTIAPGPLSGVFGKDEEVCKNASPLQHVKEKDPPFLVVWADKDMPGLGRMAEKFSDALKDSKCDLTSLEVKDRSHITIIVRLANEDDPATQAILEFLAKHSSLKLSPKEEKKEAKP